MNLVLGWIRSVLKAITHVEWAGPLLARITLGVVFIESGWGKLHNIPKVVEFFTQLGIPAPEFQAHFVAATELVGGLLVLVGLATRLASIPLAVTMVVALITAKKDDIASFSDLTGISEFLYIVLFFWLVLAGPGLVSIDAVIGRWIRKRT